MWSRVSPGLRRLCTVLMRSVIYNVIVTFLRAPEVGSA
jgi:hypothetical protein